MSSPEPKWTRPDLILWLLSAAGSGLVAAVCAVLAIVYAQDIPWANSVGGVNPWSLRSALTAMTGVIVFGLISATCTVVAVSRTAGSSTAAPPEP